MENQTQLVVSANHAQAEAVLGEQENVISLREFAEREHCAILNGLKRLANDWVALAVRVQQFKEKKLYREITDPETEKCFTRFDQWANFTLRPSVSSIFAQLKTLRELSGIVPQEKLARMTRQNAHELARMKSVDKIIDDVVIEDAAQLTAAEFKSRYSNENGAQAEQSSETTFCQLGPFMVTKSTAALFKLAIDVAKQEAAQTEQNMDDDAAIGAIARVYLAAPYTTLCLALPDAGTEAKEASAPTSVM